MVNYCETCGCELSSTSNNSNCNSCNSEQYGDEDYVEGGDDDYA